MSEEENKSLEEAGRDGRSWGLRTNVEKHPDKNGVHRLEDQPYWDGYWAEDRELDERDRPFTEEQDRLRSVGPRIVRLAVNSLGVRVLSEG